MSSAGKKPDIAESTDTRKSQVEAQHGTPTERVVLGVRAGYKHRTPPE